MSALLSLVIFLPLFQVVLKLRVGTGELVPTPIVGIGRGNRRAARQCLKVCRNGRHGMAFSRFGSINLSNARHAADPRPLDEQSNHPAAITYSRAYLHHLTKANEILGQVLLSTINLAYYQSLMAGMRAAIATGRFADFHAATMAGWEQGDIPAM